MVRNSLRLVAWKDYKAVTRDLKQVYHTATEEGALQALDAFGKEWDARYPQISRSWQANWPNVATFFVYPEASRVTNGAIVIHTQRLKSDPGGNLLS